MCPGDASNGILQREGQINQNCFWLLTYSYWASSSIPAVQARAKAIKGREWDLKDSQKQACSGKFSVVLSLRNTFSFCMFFFKYNLLSSYGNAAGSIMAISLSPLIEPTEFTIIIIIIFKDSSNSDNILSREGTVSLPLCKTSSLCLMVFPSAHILGF